MDLLMSITSGQDPKDMTTLPDYYESDATNWRFVSIRDNGSDVRSEPRNDGRERGGDERLCFGSISSGVLYHHFAAGELEED
jgi:hypothetical protein